MSKPTTGWVTWADHLFTGGRHCILNTTKHFPLCRIQIVYRLTCPGRMREINLCDQSHTSRSRGPEISRFGMDNMWLAIRIENLRGAEKQKRFISSINIQFKLPKWAEGLMTCTLTVVCGSCTCSRVASMSNATTRPEVNLKGLSDSPVGSIIVADALWIWQTERKCERMRNTLASLLETSRKCKSANLLG